LLLRLYVVFYRIGDLGGPLPTICRHEHIMKRLVEFPTEDGGSILVEVDDEARLGSGSTLRGGAATLMIEKARITYEEALDKIKAAADTIITKMRSLPESPDEVSVEFGIKMSADIGAILASTSAEAQFTLHLTWKRPDTILIPSPPPSQSLTPPSTTQED
jgi:Trypsin-co-occurring domain 1